ncbi:hypothetical protein [Thiolapillus sp.]
MRFARAFPGCTVHAVDGSLAMLEQAGRLLPLPAMESEAKAGRPQ